LVDRFSGAIQIDAAALRLFDLFGWQAGRELAADAHLLEMPDATKHPEED
jgi:hypothetical protein